MQIVLVHPDIPQNTGSIARTCAATNTPLHLIEPMKFTITEKKVRRAGLDYWPYVNLTIHKSWAEYLESQKPSRMWAFSKKASRLYTSVNFAIEDALLFGSESKGLPEEVYASIPPENLLRIPMAVSEVRSLNLSNATAIALYEARRQLALDV